jgi:hypothetical protein
MPLRSQSEAELVIETPHRRLGVIERPLVTFRQGIDHVLVEDSREKGRDPIRLPVEKIDGVRLIPAEKGFLHRWQRRRDRWIVALRFSSGDDLILEQDLEPTAALQLATTICRLSGAHLDEASRRMFGQSEAAEQG